MKKYLKFLPLFVLAVIVYITSDINYTYIGKYNYPLKYPFMNEEEREEWWKTRDPNEGVESIEGLDDLPDIGDSDYDLEQSNKEIQKAMEEEEELERHLPEPTNEGID